MEHTARVLQAIDDSASAHGPRPVSPRLASLIERVRHFEDENAPWERGVVATEVYRDEPDLTPVRQKAEVIARSFERIRPIVLPEDRIVGITFRRLRIHGGVGSHDAWRMVAKHPEKRGYRAGMPIPEEADRILQWWQEKSGRLVGIRNRNANRVQQANMQLQRHGIVHPHGSIGGHTLPAHDILLTNSIPTQRARIARKMEQVDTPEERDLLLALDRCLAGMQNHFRLCADELQLKAGQLSDPRCVENLLMLADSCRHLAEDTPRTLHEALQMIYTTNAADILDNAGDASSFGRIDQILFPFYERDLAEGRLTEEEAFELICAFVAKKWCVQTSNNLTLGGLKPDGTDGTNALSTMFLHAMMATRLTTNISVRIHANTPPAFLRTVAEAMRAGFGRAGCFNDEIMITALLRKGIALGDARDYAPLGCVEIMLPGRSAFRTMCMGMNLAKLVELTIHGGRCPLTGETVFEDVPDDFATFEDFRRSYHGLVRRVVDVGVEIIREDERLEPIHDPRPALTMLTYGCIDDPRDVTGGLPQYDPVGVTLSEIATTVNSLQALRTIVFERRQHSVAEFRQILLADWEGHEALRRQAIEQFPRFGQDDPSIATLTREEAAHYATCFEPHRTTYGGRFWPMIFGVSTGMQRGIWPKVGALPSGKLSRGPMAYSLQPEPSSPHGAITAVLNSCAAIDYLDYPGGTSNVQDCTADLFAGDNGLDRMVAVLRAYFDAGGMEVALNFLSEKTLREAQSNPERHRNLMVRLFGLSARFVELDDDLQEGIIDRARGSLS
ncbi:MAG: hypothetical protein HON70_47615 [Lentisphaerae bacterium]|nr:hypothetical protein [Lentisphaerota bacterium]